MRDINTTAFDIGKKISQATNEELNKMHIELGNNDNMIYIKEQEGKKIYMVPKRFYIMLKPVLEEEKKKRVLQEKKANEEFINENKEIQDLVNSNYYEGRISSIINDAKTMPTETYKKEVAEKNRRNKNRRKRNIRNNPHRHENNKKYKGNGKLAKIIAGLLVSGIVIGGAIAFTKGCSTEGNREIKNTTNTTNRNNLNTTNSIKEVQNDFAQIYLRGYNEKYGTNYKKAEIYVTPIAGGQIYELNQDNNIKHVTKGSYPENTQAVLETLGNVEKVNGYNNIIQIIVKDEAEQDKILGSYNEDTCEYLYSGNQLSDLQDVYFDTPDLVKLGIPKELVNAAVDVLKAKDVEPESSVDSRVATYKAIINNMEKNKEDGFEIDD